MNTNFIARIRRFCEEHSIEYREETYMNNSDMFLNYHAVLGKDHSVEIFRTDWFEYDIYVNSKKAITVTASQFRETYEIIKGELLNDKQRKSNIRLNHQEQ